MARTAKKLLTAVMTFSIAMSIGIAMQYGDAFASRWITDEPVAGPGPEKLVSAQTVAAASAQSLALPSQQAPAALRVMQAETMESLPIEVLAPEMPSFRATDLDTSVELPTIAAEDTADVGADTAPVLTTPDVDVTSPTIETVIDSKTIMAALSNETPQSVGPAPGPDETAETCAPELTATPAPLAMVTLNLVDSCHANARVAIHHQGMMFSGLTDDNGILIVDVPALQEDAFFIASFEDGEGAVALTTVPDLANFDRAVLQWQGENTVGLHALEFGASYNDKGHVWAGASGTTTDAAIGTGGFLKTLGDADLTDALMAQVYTFPSGYVLQDGAVALSVEAEVTAQNCGRDVAAQSIQIEPGADHEALDLTMKMPGCDAVGEFLVLKNMFTDLKLAAK